MSPAAMWCSTGDKLVNDIEPKDRDIAMVFQNYALYPHLSVYENMAFALKLRKLPKDEIDKKVKEAAKILDLLPLLNKKPNRPGIGAGAAGTLAVMFEFDAQSREFPNRPQRTGEFFLS